uniref:Uncharacterized protein n=1 Tax=Nelumbo nucifera TaxID=4432 RepID=A0A823A0D2_NELNU|nr:TPA_asm: hypothetical protein HUJ06_018726 [Nelumbo nucifera]
MALTELSPSYTTRFPSSQLALVSTRLYSHRRLALRPPSRARNAKVLCSIAPNEVKAPVTPQVNQTENKTDCFGVFCLTYDLKADEETKSWKKLIKIAVSGAAGMISNHLLFKVRNSCYIRHLSSTV